MGNKSSANKILVAVTILQVSVSANLLQVDLSIKMLLSNTKTVIDMLQDASYRKRTTICQLAFCLFLRFV